MELFYLIGLDFIYLTFYVSVLSLMCFDFYKKVLKDELRFHKWIANYDKYHLKKEEQIREYVQYVEDTCVNIRNIDRTVMSKIKVE
jgi:hypothetical protein